MRASQENQQKILNFIKREIEMKGYPPSVREICVGVGLKSTSTVHAHLNHLEQQGLIRRDSTKPRALEVLDGSQATRPQRAAGGPRDGGSAHPRHPEH